MLGVDKSDGRWSISALCAGFLAKMLKRQTRVLAELSSREAETVLQEEEVAVEGDGIQSESDSFTLVDSFAMSGAIVGWYRRYLSIICRDLAVDRRSLEALQVGGSWGPCWELRVLRAADDGG